LTFTVVSEVDHQLRLTAQMCGPISNFFNIISFPNEQTSNVTRYLNEAAALATDGTLHQYFQDQCIVQQVYPALFQFVPGFVAPFEAFDDHHFIGHSGVSSWAYNTTEGVVVIDALNDQEEVEEILLPGLRAFGLRREDIKHLIITHEHSDHYGGAKYIKNTFGAGAHAPENAWQGMEQMTPDADPPVPVRVRVLVDGQDLYYRRRNIPHRSHTWTHRGTPRGHCRSSSLSPTRARCWIIRWHWDSEGHSLSRREDKIAISICGNRSKTRC
jgi:hypothetical protein